MGGSRRGSNLHVSIHESEVTAIGSIVELTAIDFAKPHCFLGVQFFSDSAGLTPSVPTTGTITAKIKTYNSQIFELFPESNFSAANPATLSWAANTVAVQVIPSSIDVATFYRVVLTANEN